MNFTPYVSWTMGLSVETHLVLIHVSQRERLHKTTAGFGIWDLGFGIWDLIDFKTACGLASRARLEYLWVSNRFVEQ
ncbi:MAG TPA: hypothetical protein DER01_05470 [Phycisphaerales bacterium]|nr:hypothetical protein [Phycisphaerales bacterium]